ncbi:hypothetical protein F1880_007638 [Penicillium rolfsii]|nr:hypothetical protein F1880_007638 [Penicillium rolfsii]
MPSDRSHCFRRSSCDSSSSEPSIPEPAEGAETPSSNSNPSKKSSKTPRPIASQATPSKKRKYHPDFPAILNFLSSPLIPFVNSETGQPHPEFPRTHLAFHLLTSDQLDALARHYQQVHPAQPATMSYPFQIRSWVGIPDEKYVDIATKRRRFGYFIGMPGFIDPVNSGLLESAPAEYVGEEFGG